MTPEEIDQLIGEKIAAAISAYAATQNSGEGSKSIGGQKTATKDAKGKQEGNQEKNTAQRQNKKQKVVETSDAGQNVKRGYAGKLPYCGSCDRHHTGHCTMVCNQCKMGGHMTGDYGNPAPITKAIMAKNVNKGYVGKHPYCNRCSRHHPGRCAVVCENCKKVGHMAKDCRVINAPVINAVAPKGCYECGVMGHFKKNCPKLKEKMLKQPKEEPM